MFHILLSVLLVLIPAFDLTNLVCSAALMSFCGALKYIENSDISVAIEIHSLHKKQLSGLCKGYMYVKTM